MKAVHDVLRNKGQSAAILMLAAMDYPPDAAVDLSLLQALDRGSANFKLTLFAIRALGAGIRTGPELRKRLVATLVILLLLPENVRLGPMKCADVFSIDDLPNPIDIAKRPEIRMEVIDQLHERFGRRAASSRRNGKESPRVRITGREAQMLDRLAMWSDIRVPYARSNAGADAERAEPDAVRLAAPAAPREPRGTIVAAGLLSFAIQQLQEDADGFLAGFAEFVDRLGPEDDLTGAGRLYISELLKQYGDQ